ncbi:MAG: SpoIID/LytB domain-containing protein [Weeksellaceae bacterium]
MRRFLFVLICLFTVLFVSVQVQADELEDINKQLQDLNNALESSKKATANNEQELNKLNAQLEGIKVQVDQIETDIAEKETEITEGEKLLSKQKLLLDGRVVSFYKNKGKEKDSLLQILMSDNLTLFLQQFTYQQSLLDDDRRNIIRIALMVKEIEDKKDILVDEKTRLTPIKNQIDKQSAFLAGEVNSAKSYQGELNQKIAALSAKQQEIVNSRSGSFTATIGDSNEADDYNASIAGFRANAPAGYFAVFSFGAHTHRKGMSQYGAYGRAMDGQNFRQILQKYYGKEPASKDTNGNIKVAGHGEIDFETTYLYGIAEMPSSWHPEALKAQAVAARSYAYRYKVQGTEICTTEACQVFNKGKSDNVPDSWRQAVNDTKGLVLEDVTTFYSSTTGGYLTTSGWDTTDNGGGANFIDKSYEKKAGSPWLYKAWYTQGYSISSDKCGRANPWLSPEEMADIVNTAVALSNNISGLDTGRITPVTTSCWGGNPYSMEELRNLTAGAGGISAATSVSVSLGDGTTSSVTINGKTFSGADFKKAFNVRAPGYMSIPQYQFAFFNIERK